MQLKPGVIPIGIRPELLLALMVADGVWRRNGVELIVTSLNDGKHSPASLHYAGLAADLRTRYFDSIQKEQVAADLCQALGNNPDYDVVIEINHIHIEYQPKLRQAK